MKKAPKPREADASDVTLRSGEADVPGNQKPKIDTVRRLQELKPPLKIQMKFRI